MQIQIKLAAMLAGLLLAFSSTAYCQVKTEQQSTEQKQSQPAKQEAAEKVKPGIKLSEPVESTWEFGVRVNSAGSGKQISVSVPIPREWPEQELEVVKQNKSDNVGRLVEKDVTKYARKFNYTVSRLGAGDTAVGAIEFKVKKRLIIAPKDTSQYVIAKKVPAKVRTFLKPSPFIESNHKRIKTIAKELRDETLSGWDQVESIYTWVRKSIQYKFDVQNHSCLDALDSKHGDCEELSALFIAICRANGIPARAVWVPGHTYPEFYLEDKSGEGHWFPCQAAGMYEFGSMTEERPILQKGDRFRIPGQKDEVRYLRPTLTAREGAGLTIEWISRKVDATAEKK